MDDLAGLRWPSAQKQPGAASPGTGSAPNYSPLLSMGANSAASSSQQSRSGSTPAKPKDDPFGELVSFTSLSPAAVRQSQSKLSLRERQQQLWEEQAQSSRSSTPLSLRQSASPAAVPPPSASKFPGAAAKGAWDFDALAGVGAPPKPPRQQAAAAGFDALSFDPLARAAPAPPAAPRAPEPLSSSSDDEPIPMDIHVNVESKPEPFVDKDFEIAQVAGYGFPVDQARAALEITGSPRAAIQLLREQRTAAHQVPDRRTGAADRGHSGPSAGGRSRLRTPYRDEQVPRGDSSSDDSDGGSGNHYGGRQQSGRGGGGSSSGTDSLMASANEFGASVWKQANSWLEIGKKKFMEVHDAVADQQWPGARGSWARPEQRTEYTSSPSQRFRDYGASSSSDDDDDRYVSANRRGRQPVQHVEAPTRASPRLHTEPEAVRDSRSRRADAADLLGGMTGGLGIAREAPVPPAKPQHLRPQPTQQAAAKAAVPAVPGNALAACNAAKATANEQFKLGQFGAAVAGYTQAMAQVTSHSEQHPLLILLLNNRALAYTRNGEAKMALADCSQALALCAVYQANGTIELGGAGRVDVADQRAKALQRRAEAHEAGERYQEALADWKELREAARDGRVRQQAVHGVQRCERALGGGGSQPAKARAAAAAAPATADDIASVFASISMASIKGGGTNILNRQTESSAAVAEMRRKEQERLAEDDLRLALTDQVDADLTRWKAGKQHNLRALLSSVHTVLPAFPPIGMHEVLEAAKVKRAYMRTIARLHPDKLDKAADVRTRMVSANVFSALNEAWDAFKAQESM